MSTDHSISSLVRTSLLLTLILAGAYAFYIWSSRITEWTSENALTRRTAPTFADDLSVESLVASLDGSISYFNKLAPESKITLGQAVIPTQEMLATLIDFKDAVNKYGLTAELYRYIKWNYLFFASAAEEVLFTGYFVPELKGSRTKTQSATYPLYRRPPDLAVATLSEFFDTKKCIGCPTSIKGRLLPTGVLAPYFNRQEIDVSKVLEGKKLELAWVEDSIAAFFLHIQGSGVVELPDGIRMRVNYAEANGQPYRAIGATLIERGLLTKDNVSMQSITKLLHEREDIRQEIMSTNPSYVFFREVEGGPFGNIEVALTPGRSIATDSRLFPKGALGFIQTRVPTVDDQGAFTGWRSVRRFVLNQDTGGAIKGPGRVDLFFGTGTKAGAEAGVMKQNGAIYFMLKKHGKAFE